MQRETPRRTGQHALSCRVDDRIVAHLDALVDPGLHRTRGEAAVWLLRAGIVAQRALFTRIAPEAAGIHRARERIRDLIAGRQGSADQPGAGRAAAHPAMRGGTG